MRLAALALALLLGGCLEAADLADERLAGPAYCPTPDGVVICRLRSAEVQ